MNSKMEIKDISKNELTEFPTKCLPTGNLKGETELPLQADRNYVIKSNYMQDMIDKRAENIQTI